MLHQLCLQRKNYFLIKNGRKLLPGTCWSLVPEIQPKSKPKEQLHQRRQVDNNQRGTLQLLSMPSQLYPQLVSSLQVGPYSCTWRETYSTPPSFRALRCRFWGILGSKQGAEFWEYATLDRPQGTCWGITKKKKLFPSLKGGENRRRGGGWKIWVEKKKQKKARLASRG